MRASHDVGLSDTRNEAHLNHFGFRRLNKKDFNIFPFKWVSMGSIAEKHGVEYAKTD